MLRIPAQVDYALRALGTLAREGPGPVKADTIAGTESIPRKYLEATLTALRHGGLVHSRRGADGGYWLARPPTDITVVQVLVALEGDLVDVRALPPSEDGPPEVGVMARALDDVWGTVEGQLRAVLGEVNLADLVAGVGPSELLEISVNRAPTAGSHRA